MGKIVKIIVGVAILFSPAAPWIAVIGLNATLLVGLTALGAVLSGVAGLLAPSPFDSSDQGTQIKMAAGSAEPREYVYGERRTGGNVVYRDTTGSDNEDLWIVSTVASHEIDSFQTYYVDEKTVTLSGSAVATSPYSGGFMNIYTALGTDSQAAITDMVTALGNWTAAHQGKGNAYFAVKLKFDQDIYPGGIPDISVVIRGKKVYDPRLDSTEPGGSGAHREDNPATWAYSRNPVLQCLDYLRDSLVGANFPWTAFNSAHVMAAANLCDEDVPVVGGGTVNRYEANLVVNSEMAHAGVMQLFETAMAGEISESGGQFRFHPGAWNASDLSLDEDDITSIIVTPAPARNNLVNAVKGMFVEPAQAYQPVSYPPKTDATAETEDGGERFWLDLNLDATTDHRMAQRIAKIAFERSRRRMSVRIKTNLVGLAVKVMDVIDITHANWSWSGKTFRIKEWAFDPQSGTVDMLLREEDSTVYTWTAASDEKTFGTPATTAFWSPFGINLAIPGGVGFISLPFVGADGTSVPGLRLTYNSVAPWIQNVQAQYKLNSEAATAYRPLPNQAQIGPDEIHFPTLPEDWDIRVRNFSTLGTYSDWATVANTNVPDTTNVYPDYVQNSLLAGQNLWADLGKLYSYSGPGFQGYTKIILSAGSPPAGALEAGFVTGEEITWSADLMHGTGHVAAGQYASATLQIRDTGDSQLLLKSLTNNGAADNVWVRRSITFTVPSGFDDIHWGIGRSGTSPGTPAGTVSYRNVKIEKGPVSSKYSGVGNLGAYDQADTGQIVDLAVSTSKIEDDAVSEPFSDVQTSPQTMSLTQNLWQTITGISIPVTVPSGVTMDVWVLLSGSAHTQDSTGYSIDVQVLETGVQKFLFTYAWGSNDMTTQSEGSFDFNVPLLGRMTGAGVAKTYTVQVRLVAPFYAAAGGWQAPLGFKTRDTQLVMRRVSK